MSSPSQHNNNNNDNNHNSTATLEVPPNCDPGGMWFRKRYQGPAIFKTNNPGVQNCFYLLSLIFARCLDEEDVYVVHRKVNDTDGQYLGPTGKFKLAEARKH